MPGGQLCATGILEHVSHWQNAFATIFFEILTLVAFALFVMQRWVPAVPSEHSFSRIRMRAPVPDRPTLLQELYSQGILNRKVLFDIAA